VGIVRIAGMTRLSYSAAGKANGVYSRKEIIPKKVICFHFSRKKEVRRRGEKRKERK